MEAQFKALERGGGVDDELAAMKKALPGSVDTESSNPNPNPDPNPNPPEEELGEGEETAEAVAAKVAETAEAVAAKVAEAAEAVAAEGAAAAPKVADEETVAKARERMLDRQIIGRTNCGGTWMNWRMQRR